MKTWGYFKEMGNKGLVEICIKTIQNVLFSCKEKRTLYTEI